MSIKLRYFTIVFTALLLSLNLNAQQGEVTVDQDSDIDKLLEYKKDIKTTKIYKIQVYQSVDPDKAQREKLNFLNAYGEWPVEIVWNTPNYKVWVGNFATRLEADRALAKIKKKYMNAIIFQPKLDKKKK
ncbi:SPOR domain-containing protein [Winogradskyella sp.]|uniref:SPOR domain-containing protein n=1 Tax=Winogradskyella sp. TaxID=1883156 RepID=UPI00262C5B76|nr:SPOR domain-containing protein [Winogradskyella sp.]